MADLAKATLVEVSSDDPPREVGTPGFPLGSDDQGRDVLARLDPRSVDLANPQVHRTDQDFPVAWIRNYGEGRVFYTGLGHTDAAWDDPRIRTMMREAISWAIDGTEAARPHPIPPLP